MSDLQIKLLELEQERESIERCQKSLREQMQESDNEDYLAQEMIYGKNKEELKEVNKNIEILNNALDIINNIK